MGKEERFVLFLDVSSIFGLVQEDIFSGKEKLIDNGSIEGLETGRVRKVIPVFL